MDALADGCFILGTKLMCYAHIYTASHTDEKACEQRDQQGSRAYRPKSLITGKLTYNCHVAHVKHDLQDLGQH